MPLPGALKDLKGVRRQKSVILLPMVPKSPKDLFAFDATLAQSLELPGTVTRYAVADGEISDHVHLDNAELSLEAVITDTPIEFLSGLRGSAPGADRAMTLWDHLVDLRNRKELLFVIRSRGTMSNMVIEHLAERCDPETGAAFMVSIRLRKITIASTGTVEAEFDADALALGAAGTADLGEQAANLEPPVGG